jgi:beta-lactam-binding protein with PASTA domain
VSVPTTISLVLSGGLAAIQMPSLIGRDVDAARQTLMQLGARDVQIIWDPMAIGARGTVVAQSPVTGATVLPGASMQLRVAGGEVTAPVTPP